MPFSALTIVALELSSAKKTAWRMLAGMADNRLDLAVRTVRWDAVSEWIFRCAEVREDKVRLG